MAKLRGPGYHLEPSHIKAKNLDPAANNNNNNEHSLNIGPIFETPSTWVLWSASVLTGGWVHPSPRTGHISISTGLKSDTLRGPGCLWLGMT